MCNSLLELIEWHDEKEVIEYTYGLAFFWGEGRNQFGLQRSTRPEHWFGEKYLTEALTFSLNPSIIKLIQEKFRANIENESGKISPSVIKAFKAFVLTDKDHGGALINPHALESLIAVLIFNEWKNTPITPLILSEYICDAAERAADFRPTMELFIRTQMKLNQKYDVENPDQFEPDSLVDSRVRYSLEILKTVSNIAEDFDGFLDLWNTEASWVHSVLLLQIQCSNSLEVMRMMLATSSKNARGWLVL